MEPVSEPVTTVTPIAPISRFVVDGLSGEPLTIEQAFEVWWSEWPNRTKRKEAAKVFGNILRKREATFAELMHGQRRYAQTDRVRRGFIQNPTTWLRGEGWKDEHPAPSPNASQGLQPRQQWSGVEQAIAGLVDDDEPLTGRAA